MKLTTKTRYAARAMVDLVNQPKGKPVPLAMVAKRQGVTPRYLSKIFSRLQSARLVTSKKGPGGGYFIERDPTTISLCEILGAVGEQCAPVFCVAGKRRRNCNRMKYCPTRPYWNELKDILENFFSNITLSALAGTNKKERAVNE